MQELGNRVSRLEGALEQIPVMLSALTSRMDAIEHRMDGLERRMDERIDGLQAGHRWTIGLVFTSWVSIIGTVLAVHR